MTDSSQAEAKQNDGSSSASNMALVIGGQIKEIVQGSPIEKDAMLLGAMYASGYFKDMTSLSKAITKALIGQEMGMGLVQAMNSLYVIDGKVAMDSHAIRNTAVMAGYSIKTLELSKDKAVLEWSVTRDGKPEVLGTSEYTWEDATMAGLANKSNWKQYPKDMLFARAITRGARMYANQAFANQPVYEREELAPDNGKLIDLGPMDERVDQIRNAKDLTALQNVMEDLTPDEQSALSHEISDKTKELLNATSSKN
jgi:hypothetical protein